METSPQKRDFDILKSLARPPKSVITTFHAGFVLLGHPSNQAKVRLNPSTESTESAVVYQKPKHAVSLLMYFCHIFFFCSFEINIFYIWLIIYMIHVYSSEYTCKYRINVYTLRKPPALYLVLGSAITMDMNLWVVFIFTYVVVDSYHIWFP